MSDDKEPGIFAHDADGITELDNQLPRWWLWLFILTVIWSVGYLLYFEVARVGLSSKARYEAEMAAAGKAITAPVDTGPTEPSTEAAVLASGQQLFIKNCVSCHGPQGGGLIGPNLCDDYYLHGPAFADMLRTIREGVPIKGMIAWRTVLKPSDIHAVASYTWMLHGTTPLKPKAPEGVKAEPPPPEPAVAATPSGDTVATDVRPAGE